MSPSPPLPRFPALFIFVGQCHLGRIFSLCCSAAASYKLVDGFYLLPSILLYLSPTIQQQGNFRMTRHALNALCGRSHHYQPILVFPPLTSRVSPSRFFVTFISLVNSYFYQTVKSGQVFFWLTRLQVQTIIVSLDPL